MKRRLVVGLFNEILGREVDLPDSPQRIVSFSPAITESLFMMGLGDRVAGVSPFCARPPEASAKRKVGSYNSVRYEVLDQVRPDLIFTVTGYQRNFALKLSERYPVYPLELPVSVAGIADQVVKLGLVVGDPESGRELSSRLIRLLGSFPRRKPLRTYVEIDLGGPVSFGAHSYITDAIRFLGSTTLFDGVRSEWLTPDLQLVSSRDPDVIIYEAKMFSEFDRKKLDRLVDARGWRDMRAVRGEHYYLTPGPLDFLAHHGPSFVTTALPWLGRTLEEAGTT